jgi:hypothetical protein
MRVPGHRSEAGIGAMSGTPEGRRGSGGRATEVSAIRVARTMLLTRPRRARSASVVFHGLTGDPWQVVIASPFEGCRILD